MQTLASSQLVPSGKGELPAHTPALQAEACVQLLPSLQLVPSGALGLLHAPVLGSQLPTAWQASEATQVIGEEPTHFPAAHALACVQALSSSQLEPSGTVVPRHVPDWHVSSVQGLPSSQALPLGRGVTSQAPVWGLHVLLCEQVPQATHTTGTEPTQAPATQRSRWVHASPSLQRAPSGRGTPPAVVQAQGPHGPPQSMPVSP